MAPSIPLRQYFPSSASHSFPLLLRSAFSLSSPTSPHRSIAVLGGGLAGLTSAYYLARGLPSSSNILLLENQSRFGGWVHSLNPAPSDHRNGCVFEAGPRSVRPTGLAGLITLDLVKNLGLMDSLIMIPKSHPSAKNRYIYTQSGLQKLPSSLLSLITSIYKQPIYQIPLGLFRDLVRRPDERPIEDESVREFIGRRFGMAIGEELVSGMVHGIYAGDYGRLSARSSVFGRFWELERQFGSVIKGLRNARHAPDPLERALAAQLPSELTGASVWGLRGGLETLTARLRVWLDEQPNVVLKSGERVEAIERETDGLYKVTTSVQTYGQLDHLVSALPPQVLHSCLPQTLQANLAPLTHNPSVTVGVVNLAYRTRGRMDGIPAGFGYLIPSSIGAEVNPHRVLGVVFDSEMMPGVDEERGQAKGKLTKLTVMLGGHYYEDGRCGVPTPEELVEQARESLEAQLGVRESPAYAMAHVQRDCIPQYLVGHHQRMARLHEALKGHNLSLVGSGYGGVGVNDVVRSSYEAVENLLRHGWATGLERFQKV